MMRRIRRAVILLAVLSCIAGIISASASGFYTYTTPQGFTSTEQYDPVTSSLTLSLISADKNLTLSYRTEYFVDFVGMNLAAMPADRLPWVMAMIGIDTEQSGLTATVVVEQDDLGLQYAYITLKDSGGQQDYIVSIGTDGWLEYNGLARADKPLAEADYDIHYLFYESLNIGWVPVWEAQG